MGKLNPCYEFCWLRHQKEYSKEHCDGNCEFADVCAERNKLKRFKEYFDNLYGQGLEIVNWHLNEDVEPFDNFYESALEEMENG